MGNKNKKYRFNIIDLLILLTVVAIGVVMYLYVSASARNLVVLEQDVEIEYVIELKTVHRDYVDNIKVGDTVVEPVREQQIGKIVGVEFSPAYNIATNTQTGEMFIQQYPIVNEAEVAEGAEPEYDYYNAKVKVRETLKKTKEGYKKNVFVLRVGNIVYFRIPNFVGEGYCIQINEISNGGKK